MKYRVKRTLLAASILVLLVLLVSACDTESQSEIDQPAAQESDASSGAKFEAGGSTPEGNVDDVNQATEVESGQTEQAEQAPAGAEEEVSGVEPENIPSQEERNAILDSVNRGGPDLSGSEEIGEGPAPGTESVIGQ